MIGADMPPTKVKKANKVKVSTKQSLLKFSVKKNVSRTKQQVSALQKLRRRPSTVNPSLIKKKIISQVDITPGLTESGDKTETPPAKSLTVRSRVDHTSILRLRIPKRLRKVLPSIKKFNKREMKKFTKRKPEVKAESLEKQLDEKFSSAELNLGIKKRRGENLRYQLTQVGEHKFKGMIWDVGLSTTGNLVVSHMDGAVLMDNNMENSKKLENVFLGGGICFLPDERIVVLCRCFDCINIFTPTGDLMTTFSAGKSPQNVAVTSEGHLIVTDLKDKCLSVFSVDGDVVRKILTEGIGYKFVWPMYIATANNGLEAIVSDCGQQKLYKFNTNSGSFLGEFCAQTYQGDQVLRPHGIAISQDGDVMVVDTAVDSIEVFHTLEGKFLQTLLQAEEVSTGMRLKAVSISMSGHMVVGCLSGLVRLYKTAMVDSVIPIDRVKARCIKSDNNSYRHTTASKGLKRQKSSNEVTDLTACYTAVKRERPFANSIINHASQSSNNNDSKSAIENSKCADVIVLD